MKTLKQESIQALKVIILAIVISLGLGIVQAWVGPTVAPTGGNVDAPINVGSVTQIKTGAFWAGGLLSSAGGYFADQVGIGVVSPTEKLEVDGSVVVTGNINTSDVYLTSIGKWTSELYPTWLVNNQHTAANCSGAGGTVITSGANKFCKFAGASCPVGWVIYSNWMTTSPSYCSYPAHYPCKTPCTTGSHAFANTARETCVYRMYYADFYDNCFWTTQTGAATCYAGITERGCY